MRLRPFCFILNYVKACYGLQTALIVQAYSMRLFISLFDTTIL